MDFHTSVTISINFEKISGIGTSPSISLLSCFHIYNNMTSSHFKISERVKTCDKSVHKLMKYPLLTTYVYWESQCHCIMLTFISGHDLQNMKLEVEDNIEPINFKTLQEAIDKFKNHFEEESITEVID